MLRHLLNHWPLAAAFVLAPVVALWITQPPEAPAAASGAADAYRQLGWPELIPKEWDPLKRLRSLRVEELNDSDPRAIALQRQLRETWDNAPTNYRVEGARATLSGYVVPLDLPKGGLKEFLLVPYFGACIHSPPPPANQIVHVFLAQPRDLRTMDAVSVSGVLRNARGGSPMGMSGYAMDAAHVQPHQQPNG